MMKIDGKTQVYGLLGHPVAYSLSPLIQNAAFQKLGINAVYVTFDVKNLEKAMAGVRGLNLRGVNITHPWKSKVIAFLDEITDIARTSGAVNTVLNKDGYLTGTNTDVTGLIHLFKKKNFQWKNKTVTVLGAGGAARAVITALKTIGAYPIVYNRQEDQHLSVAITRDFNCPCFPLESVSLTSDTVALINCTTVGMAPGVERIPLPASLLRKDLVVMDAVYSPVRTRLLTEAEKTGCTLVYGSEWLIAQGADAFSFWTGKKSPESIMKKTLEDWMAQNAR